MAHYVNHKEAQGLTSLVSKNCFKTVFFYVKQYNKWNTVKMNKKIRQFKTNTNVQTLQDIVTWRIWSYKPDSVLQLVYVETSSFNN